MNIFRWLNSLNARRAAAPRPAPRVPGLRGWEQLEDRVVPSAASDAFVAKLYTDLFDRPAAASEVAAWSRLFDAGATDQRQTALQLQGSAEYRYKIVTELFRTALGRAPDVASLNIFAEQLRTQAVERVEAAVLGSAEFFRRFGGTNTGFVAGLYQVVLKRTPDAAGVSYYVQALSAGTSREEVARQFLTSTEHHVRSVFGAYEELLGRAPEVAGLRNWVEYLSDGGTRQGLLAGLAAAPEYTAPPPPPAPPAATVTVTPPVTQSTANGSLVTGLQIRATGTGTGPLIYTATSLPPGLSINPLTGVISGTVSATASNNSPYNVTVRVSQGAATGTANFTWVVPTSTVSTLPFSLTDAGWITLPSGVRYKDVTVGTGATAAVGSNITVGYNGYLTNGTQFDSNTSFSSTLNTANLIKGWVDAIPGMKVGGVRLLDIPSSQAYGSTPRTGIPANSELAFRVELKGVS